mmetsp:Transcript_3437/g.15656  ORF Transcript_3437/g.15656 Transcript_3437/m.15656 type:complete len:233 (-) Transcript_3437:1429-2127(-)
MVESGAIRRERRVRRPRVRAAPDGADDPTRPTHRHRVAAGEAARGCADVRSRARRAPRLGLGGDVPGGSAVRAPRARRVEPAGAPVTGHARGGRQARGAAHRRARWGRGGGRRTVRGGAGQGPSAAGSVCAVCSGRVQGGVGAPTLRREAPRYQRRCHGARRRYQAYRRRLQRCEEQAQYRVQGTRGAGHALARGFVPDGDPARQTRRRRVRVRRRRRRAPLCPPRAGVPRP